MVTRIYGLTSEQKLPATAKGDLRNDFASLDEQGRQPVRKGEIEVNVKDYGVTGNGTTDDAPAINALIASRAKDTTLYFPPGDYRVGSPIVLKSGIVLTGRRAGFGYQSRWTTRLRTIGAVSSIVTHDPTVPLYNAGVQGLDFEGSGVALKGIHWPQATWCVIRDVHMHFFLDQFVLIDNGAADVIDNFLGVNGLRRPISERTTRVGSIELGGTDHMLSRIQTGGGYLPEQGVTSGMFNCAYLIKGGSNFGTHLVGEFSETGFWFTGSAVGNRFALCRADKGGGDGYVVEGNNNAFTACHSANNAREANNVYSGFRAAASSYGNTFSACRVHYLSSFTSNLPKYAFEDLRTGGDPWERNAWAGCTGRFADRMHFSVDFEGGAPIVPPNPKRHPANSETIDVTNTGIAWLGSYNVPTTITGMLGGVMGQSVKVIAANTNVTVAHNGSVSSRGSIYTNTGSAKVLQPYRAYEFVNFNGCWYESAA